MARYIDAERMPNDSFWEGLTDKEKAKVLQWLLQSPTADVVEVVRCKDCDVPHNKWTGCPHLNGLIPPPNHYCALGGRSENGGC